MMSEQKKTMRTKARQLRRDNPPSLEHQRALMHYLLDVVAESGAQKIAAVWPLEGEPDLRPLMSRLVTRGHVVLLPQTTPKGQPLLFRTWTTTVRMREGLFGTMYPESGVETPDLLLVPLLAFDRQCHRLGYGGGYYDRTIAALQCPSVGFGFSWQEMDKIPVDAFDAILDEVVTERERIRRAVND